MSKDLLNEFCIAFRDVEHLSGKIRKQLGYKHRKPFTYQEAGPLGDQWHITCGRLLQVTNNMQLDDFTATLLWTALETRKHDFTHHAPDPEIKKNPSVMLYRAVSFDILQHIRKWRSGGLDTVLSTQFLNGVARTKHRTDWGRELTLLKLSVG